MHRRRTLLEQLGGLAWILGVFQYFVVQVVVAAGWTSHYSLHDNYISDLGNTACGPFAVPHGPVLQVCSPGHAAMNTSFVITGILTIVGAILLRTTWPARRIATAATVLWVIAGLGKIVVGVVPENTDTGLHLLGAFNIPITSIAILLLGLAYRRTAPGQAASAIVLAILGLVGTILSTAGQFFPVLYLGLGVGGAERLAGYPGNLWMLITGALVVLAFRRDTNAYRGNATKPKAAHQTPTAARSAPH